MPGKSIKIRDPSSGDVTTFAATTKNQKIRIAIDAERPIAGAKYRPASGQCRCDLPPWEACSGCPDLIRVQASSEPGEAA